MRTNEQHFRSKIGGVQMLVVLVLLASGIARAREVATGHDSVWSLLFVIALLAVTGWWYLTTSYVVTDEMLVVRSGPWRQSVPLRSITSLRRSHSSVAAPALSLHRILVLYDFSSSVVVSPTDKTAFIRAIRQRAPGVALVGLTEQG